MSSENRVGFYLISVLGIIATVLVLLIGRAIFIGSSPSIIKPAERRSSPQQDKKSDALSTPEFVSPTPKPLNELEGKRIRDLNEKGLAHYSERKYEIAASYFRRALDQNPNNQSIRQNLAYAQGSFAWQLIELNQLEEARLLFQEAIDLNIQDPTFYMGLGVIHYQLKDEGLAIQKLKKAISIRPSYAEPYKLLGNIYTLRDEMDLSVGYYEKAIELDPEDRGLADRLAKARREQSTQSTFQRKATRHFTVKFEGREEQDVARGIIQLLEEAYREIGQALSTFPEVPITVILYSEKQFRDVTLSPNWVDGVFDGKIRIPIQGSQKDPVLLKKVIYHEYAHAVIYEISNGKTPIWFNEGLALNLEGAHHSNREKYLMIHVEGGGPLIPLQQLHGSFMSFSGQKASLAYAQSYWATQMLIDRYGLFRLKEVLLRLSEGNSFEDAFASQFMKSYNQFEKEWKQDVERRAHEDV